MDWKAALAGIWLATTGATAHAQADIDATPALEAARIWLATLDAGRYGAAWEDAAPLLRDATPKVPWETTLERARGALGVVIVRKIRQAACSRGTQVDPETEICVIQYDTRFEDRPLGSEQATVLRSPDGTWRVAAYQLR